MSVDLTFELSVHIVFCGSYTWRLEEGELRYCGTGSLDDPAIGTIPVFSEQIAQFTQELDALDVWNWKPVYQPEDLGISVDDGGYWSFKAHLDDRTCQTAGDNAYPSFESAAKTSLESERYGRLVERMQSIFGLPQPQPRNERIDLGD